MLEKEVLDVVRKSGYEVSISDLEEPKEEFGDLSLKCFRFAREKGKNPQEVAKEIAEKLEKPWFLEKVEAVGGYLNFFFKWNEVAKKVLKDLLSGEYSISNPFEGKRVMVEHTSVNPNKALHIGHARNACLGDCIVRLLRFLGNDVVVVNYVDDTGAQMADIVVGFKVLGIPLETERKFDEYCGNEVYVKVNKIYEEKPELKEERRKILALIEKGDNEIARFSNEIAERVLKEQLKTLWRLGIFYDLINRESDVIRSRIWEEVFEKLKKEELVYKEEQGERKGCWLFKLSLLPEFKNLKNPDITIIRSDGTVLYVGKDIAYAMWKHGLTERDFKYKIFLTQPNGKELWITCPENGEEHPEFKGVDISINVIDVRQKYEQDAVHSALRLISKEKKEYIHYAYELVALSKETASSIGIDAEKFVHMSGRKGWFVNADTILEALFKKAYEETKKRNPEASEEFLKDVAEKITVGSLRYEMEKISPESMIVFDMESSLKLEGNTAPYLQYAYTRCMGIIRKAGELEEIGEVREIGREEKRLLKVLARFPKVIELAARDLKPNYIANYAYELVSTFNEFYEKCPVIKCEKEKSVFRKGLVYATKEILGKCLDLLGIPKLERM